MEQLTREQIDQLITDIKQKKELQEISDDFVKQYLLKHFRKEQKVEEQLSKKFNKKSALYKQIIKSVRADLRRVYGLFRVDEGKKKRQELIKELLKAKNREETIIKILETHSSTKERLTIYAQLYQKILKLTKNPKKIIDLGCGINPFSLHFIKNKNVTYHAYDISKEEISVINSYFQILKKENENFKGEAKVLDALQYTKLKTADVCFLFKMTDVLDRGKGHKTSEEVISGLPVKYVVVSFATKTMSGKKMNYPRRGWIELMCKRLGYKFQLLEYDNELFYIIDKINQS
jgi:hypothetical protein